MLLAIRPAAYDVAALASVVRKKPPTPVDSNAFWSAFSSPRAGQGQQGNLRSGTVEIGYDWILEEIGPDCDGVTKTGLSHCQRNDLWEIKCALERVTWNALNTFMFKLHYTSPVHNLGLLNLAASSTTNEPFGISS